MRIVSLRDNMHEMTSLISELIQNSISNCCLLNVLPNMQCVKTSLMLISAHYFVCFSDKCNYHTCFWKNRHILQWYHLAWGQLPVLSTSVCPKIRKNMSLTIPILVLQRPFCYLNFISVAKPQKFGNETYDAHVLASSKTYKKQNKPKKWTPNPLRYMSFWQVSLSFRKNFLNLYYNKDLGILLFQYVSTDVNTAVLTSALRNWDKDMVFVCYVSQPTSHCWSTTSA